MSLELLREKFGHSGVTKEVDNKEKIHEKLSTRFVYEKEADNEEKIHEKLNAQFNDMGDFKNIKVQHQEQLDEKQRIIENFKIETSELTNEVATLKKDKSVLLGDLNKSKWMEDKVHSTAKQIYEDKIKTMSYVDSTELIPLLISVSREKQGNTRLNWGNWLKISENKYLFQINESLAKKVFEDTNVLIDRAVGFINRRRGQGGETFTTIYGLSFDGLTQHVETTFGGTSLNGGTPTDRTYSFWMKASQAFSTGPTVENRGVFGYGDNNREAFLINKSQSNIGKPLLQLDGGFYKYFMTPDHEEDEGGTSGVADGGSNEATSHIEAQDDGQWHHWMVFSDVSDASNGKLYIDGIEQDQAKFRDQDVPNNHLKPLSIGAVWIVTADTTASNNRHFAGSVTNFAVFSDDKTANASSHYNNGIPNKDLSGESGLVGYWKMDENGGTNVADSSGNGNDGTIANEAEWISFEISDEGNIR